jgi:hypothetical protein
MYCAKIARALCGKLEKSLNGLLANAFGVESLNR